MAESDEGCLFVMYKPDGLWPECSSTDIQRISDAWNAVLDWLRGRDPDELLRRNS